jgi:chloramphenicol 3-O phosphotransferase
MSAGYIIFLNGTSSSGKTTIAKALQEELAEPYMHVSIDSLFCWYPERVWNPTSREEILVTVQLVPCVVSGFHRMVATLAKAGINVIVDHLLEEDGWLAECVEQWAGLDVLFVGVKCPLQVVEQRETERDDRKPGTARYQYDRVHAHNLYDIEVDTSILGVEECATRIMALIDDKPATSAFQELASRFRDKESTIAEANP